MRVLILFALALLLAALPYARYAAAAHVPPEEVNVTTVDAKDVGLGAPLEISWKNYHLWITVSGGRSYVEFSFGDPSDSGNGAFIALELEEDCPALLLSVLPPDRIEPMRVCVEMAQATKSKETAENKFPPKFDDVLQTLSERRFTFTDYTSAGELSLRWLYEYRGPGRSVHFHYLDSSASYVVVENPDGITLALRGGLSPYTVELTLAGNALKVKALHHGGGGPPDETAVRDFLHKVVGRARRILSGEGSGAPKDVVQVLEHLDDALAKPERFDSYEVVKGAFIPTF